MTPLGTPVSALPAHRAWKLLLLLSLCLLPGDPPPAGRDADPRAVNPTWWAGARQSIQRMEYEASPTEQGLQAPNRAHNLRTLFQAGRVEIGPRLRPHGSAGEPAEQASWRWSWRLLAWGRVGRMRPASPTPPRHDHARVTYERGDLAEWYVNGSQGLEQGFTIARRPGGDGPIRIEGALAGDLEAVPTGDGRGVDLIDGKDVRVLRYAGLVARDAGGRELPARIALAKGRLALVVDDRRARDPVVVDPLVTSPSWTSEADQANAGYGFSVATAGDVNGDGFSDVIVGAYGFSGGTFQEGRAFVFHGSATGLSSSPAWTAESNQMNAWFGFSVATAGDIDGDGYDDVIVGSPQEDRGAIQDAGFVRVYLGSASGLATAPDFSGADARASARLDGPGAGIGLPFPRAPRAPAAALDQVAASADRPLGL